MTGLSSLPSAVTQANVLTALKHIGDLAGFLDTDREVRHFITGEEQLSSDPVEYLRWIDHLGEERLKSPKSRAALARSVADLNSLRKTAGLGTYAAAEAMQICLSDLALIEDLDQTDIPPSAIKTLRDDLVVQSIDLVNRLLRNVTMRAKAADQRRLPADHPVRRLAEIDPPTSVSWHFDGGEPVLAVVTAGRGTRLRSTIPKGLVPIGGVPMIDRVVDAARQAGIRQVMFVVKYRAEIQVDYLARRGPVIVQDDAAGTAHSAFAALANLHRHRAPVIVTYSDQPFVTKDSFSRPMAAIDSTGSDLVISTIQAAGTELGRVIRNSAGQVARIAQPRLGDHGGDEADAGLYGVRCDRVLAAFGNIRNDNVRREFNLPDVVAELAATGNHVLAVTARDEEFQSVNTPRDLILAQLREAAGLPLGSAPGAAAFFSALGASGQSPTSTVTAGMEAVMSLVGPVLDLRRSAA